MPRPLPACCPARLSPASLHLCCPCRRMLRAGGGPAAAVGPSPAAPMCSSPWGADILCRLAATRCRWRGAAARLGPVRRFGAAAGAAADGGAGRGRAGELAAALAVRCAHACPLPLVLPSLLHTQYSIPTSPHVIRHPPLMRHMPFLGCMNQLCHLPLGPSAPPLPAALCRKGAGKCVWSGGALGAAAGQRRHTGSPGAGRLAGVRSSWPAFQAFST